MFVIWVDNLMALREREREREREPPREEKGEPHSAVVKPPSHGGIFVGLRFINDFIISILIVMSVERHSRHHVPLGPMGAITGSTLWPLWGPASMKPPPDPQERSEVGVHPSVHSLQSHNSCPFQKTCKSRNRERTCLANCSRSRGD